MLELVVGRLAQLVERVVDVDEVAGSIPSPPTKLPTFYYAVQSYSREYIIESNE